MSDKNPDRIFTVAKFVIAIGTVVAVGFLGVITWAIVELVRWVVQHG